MDISHDNKTRAEVYSKRLVYGHDGEKLLRELMQLSDFHIFKGNKDKFRAQFIQGSILTPYEINCMVACWKMYSNIVKPGNRCQIDVSHINSETECTHMSWN